MFTTLDRYIARRIVIATGLVLSILLVLLVFHAVVDAMPDYGKGRFGLSELARYVLLSMPRRLYEISPVVTLMGVLIGLAGLAASSELTAIRAAGVSVSRIVASAVQVGLMFALLAFLVGEYVVPGADSQAESGRQLALGKTPRRSVSGVWIRDGAAFVNFREVLPDDYSLRRVDVYDFEDDIRLQRQLHAARAQPMDTGWQLEDVAESRLGEASAVARRVESLAWDSSLTREIVSVFTVRPDQLSVRHLGRYIEHLRANRQNTSRYALVFWQKLLMPLAVVTMVLLAAPFAFGQIRSGGLSARIFAGVMLGLAFVLITRLVGHLMYGSTPFLAAAFPIGLFLAAALWRLRRVH